MASSNSPKSDRSDLAERYRVLLEIGRTLAGTLSLDDLFRSIYRETSRVVAAGGFYISLYDADEDLATVVFYADQNEEQRVQVTYKGSSSEVIRTGKPCMVDDRLQLESLMVLGEDGSPVTRSAISAPLLNQGRVLGAISTQSYEPDTYGPDDLELLQGIADIAAVAIENARQVKEIRQRRLEAEKLEEIGRTLARTLDPQEVFDKIVEAVSETLATDGATVWLLEDDDRHAVIGASHGDSSMPAGARVSVDAPIVDLTLNERRPIILDDIRSTDLIPEAVKQQLRSRSGIMAPLVVGDRVLGALSAGHHTPRKFTDEDAHLLQRLASQAAVSLENARLHESLQSMSLTDPLTGLPNRRHLRLHLDREVAAARRGRTLALVIFDLDGFKGYNDTLGHLEGDRALETVGEILRAETRAMNLAARYGGDEFVSVLSESHMKGAEYHAHRVQEKVAEVPRFARHGLTLSFGLAEFDPETMKTGEDLIRAADSRLYTHKREPGASAMTTEVSGGGAAAGPAAPHPESPRE
jgi:diguanylate cyclase (GGDEF)-like protein